MSESQKKVSVIDVMTDENEPEKEKSVRHERDDGQK